MAFFATSHGKQPCDGIGGTVKRLVTKASLQRDVSNQILDHKVMLEFCKTQIRDIIFLFVDKNQLQETREAFAQRFEGTIFRSRDKVLPHVPTIVQ